MTRKNDSVEENAVFMKDAIITTQTLKNFGGIIPIKTMDSGGHC